jgi:sulfite exporter TauE/SafE
MWQILIKGFTLGLSLGTSCLATCSPVYLPYLISEDRKLGKSIIAVLEISAGRFLSYMAFGAMAGYTGSKISALNRELFTAIAYILLSIYLILSAIRTRQKDRKCHIPELSRITKSAFLLGILTGINFCPSFLIAFSNAVDLGGAVSGMVLFFSFFIGTSLYLFPLAFIGQLSKVKVMKLIAQIASIIIAIYFIADGVDKLNHFFSHAKVDTENSRIVEAFHPDLPILIFSATQNKEYFLSLRDSASVFHSQDVVLFQDEKGISDTLEADGYILFIDNILLADKDLAKVFDRFDYFSIDAGFPISRLLNFLRIYSFKTNNRVHYNIRNRE